MRGDFEPKEFLRKSKVGNGFKYSAMNPSDSQICGFNVLKTARVLNIFCGVALTVISGANAFELFTNEFLG